MSSSSSSDEDISRPGRCQHCGKYGCEKESCSCPDCHELFIYCDCEKGERYFKRYFRRNRYGDVSFNARETVSLLCRDIASARHKKRSERIDNDLDDLFAMESEKMKLGKMLSSIDKKSATFTDDVLSLETRTIALENERSALEKKTATLDNERSVLKTNVATLLDEKLSIKRKVVELDTKKSSIGDIISTAYSATTSDSRIITDITTAIPCTPEKKRRLLPHNEERGESPIHLNAKKLVRDNIHKIQIYERCSEHRCRNEIVLWDDCLFAHNHYGVTEVPVLDNKYIVDVVVKDNDTNEIQALIEIYHIRPKNHEKETALYTIINDKKLVVEVMAVDVLKCVDDDAPVWRLRNRLGLDMCVSCTNDVLARSPEKV